jgi:hypothetical protein
MPGETDHPPGEFACRGALELVLALKVADGLHSLLEVREQSIELSGGTHPNASRRYRCGVTPRTRNMAIALAAALVLAGVACAVLVPGVTGEILTFVLIATGLGGGLVLVFLEIGFGEERDLAREEERKRKRTERTGRRRPRLPRRRGPD